MVDDVEDPAVLHTYQASNAESLSDAVVAAVSEATGRDPVPDDGQGGSLDPLYEVVDPDALDTLFARAEAEGSTSRGRTTFRYEGHVVTAHSEGRVTVRPLETAEGCIAD